MTRPDRAFETTLAVVWAILVAFGALGAGVAFVFTGAPEYTFSPDGVEGMSDDLRTVVQLFLYASGVPAAVAVLVPVRPRALRILPVMLVVWIVVQITRFG